MDPIFDYTCSDQPFSGCIAPNLSTWIVGTISGDVLIFSKETKDPTTSHFVSGSVRSVEFDETGRNFVTGDKSGNIFLTDIEILENSVSIKRAHHESIECIRFITSSLIAVGDTGGYIKIWDLRSSKAVQSHRYEQDFISDIAVVDEKNFITTCGLGCANIININSPKRKQYYVQEDDDFSTVTYNYFMNHIVIGSSKPKIYVTKYPSMDFVCESPGNSKSPIVLIRSFKTERNRVAICHDDGSICIAEISPNRSVVAFRAHKDNIFGGTLQGTTMMTWDHDKIVKIWDLSEISKTPLPSSSKNKKKGKKQKKMRVAIKEHPDNFFAEY